MVEIAKEAGAAIPTQPNRVSFSRLSNDTLLVRLAGSWRIQDGLPSVADIQQQIEAPPQIQRLTLETQAITGWDSTLLSFLLRVMDLCARQQIQVNRDDLPEGVKRLLNLAAAVPERQGARKAAIHDSSVVQIGRRAIAFQQAAADMLGFLGEAATAFLKLLYGKARFRRSDLALLIQECGAQALPIVTLVSVLMGLTLAFVGAAQLRQFGTEIYVANLVGMAMARETGASITAIIMAGRTGAAFAAQLGTMMVNEEIDALETLGFSAVEFLVLPRMLALIVMLPLLTLYSDLAGIFGGMIIGVGILDLNMWQYFEQTRQALTLTDFLLGFIKGAVYGVIIALASCLRGMQCGRSAAAVGAATTSAVVTSIVGIIVASALLTLIYDVLGF